MGQDEKSGEIRDVATIRDKPDEVRSLRAVDAHLSNNASENMANGIEACVGKKGHVAEEDILPKAHAELPEGEAKGEAILP